MDNSMLISLLSKYKVPKEFHDTFISFQENCYGRVGGYGLNRWIWGIFHKKASWLPENDIVVEFDKAEQIWHINCSEGHLSDTWTIDQNGSIYWCWSKKSDHYMNIVDDYSIDYRMVVEIINSKTISSDIKLKYLTDETHILQQQLIGAPITVLESIERFLSANHS